MIGYLLRREYSRKQVLGHFYAFNGLDPVFSCATLEPPWKDNRRNVSCIPPGSYSVVYRHSHVHRHHYHVQSVPNRSLILWHSGNRYDHSQGCILPGVAHTDIDGDGFKDVVSSRDTLRRMLAVMGDSWQLRIIE